MYDIFVVSNRQYFPFLEEIQIRFPFIKTASSISDAQVKSLTHMFWVIWDDLKICDNFNFEIHIPEWDKQYVHVFKNLNGDIGVCLIPKSKEISKKENDYRFFINSKHIDIVASYTGLYDKFIISSYEDYENAYVTSRTEMFWCIYNEIVITDNSIFELYFDPRNKVYDYDRDINHVFLNQDIDDKKYNGLMLMSKNKKVPKREIDFRFLVEKKEHDKLVSKLKPYDIVFISYNESNADKNYQRLLDKNLENKIYRIHGIKGIHQAHIEAAKIVTTPMFWVVDGDAVITNDFSFSHLVPRHDRHVVHVWHSKNPINGLEYGYGGVKLLPKKQTLEMDINSSDMTSSISTSFKVMPGVSNVTEFNVDPFSTWRSAFRECVKLSSKIILGQVDEETESRLDAWCNIDSTAAFANYAKQGAQLGKEYGQNNAGNIPALNMINNFEWLKHQFELSSDINGKTLEITSAQALATS